MRSQQAFARCEVQRKGPVSGLARSSLERLAGSLDRHLDDGERYPKPLAESARGRAQRGGGGLQSMIDVYRAKRAVGKLRERAQQAGGIGAAAHARHESRDVRRKMLAEDGIEHRRAEFHLRDYPSPKAPKLRNRA